MVRTQVQLTEEQIHRLKGVAAERGISVAELIREAVDRHVSIAVTPVGRRERAVSSIGGFHSGLSNVSEQHDRYVAESYDAE